MASQSSFQVVTDNRNRTVAEVRHVLNRYGGNMAEAGSVAWQFKRICISLSIWIITISDEIFELAVEAGADDVTFEDNWAEIVGPVEVFKAIIDALQGQKSYPR